MSTSGKKRTSFFCENKVQMKRWKPENRILKSGFQPLMESEIHRHGIRNPQTWNPESGIQDSLGLPYMGRYYMSIMKEAQSKMRNNGELESDVYGWTIQSLCYLTSKRSYLSKCGWLFRKGERVFYVRIPLSRSPVIEANWTGLSKSTEEWWKKPSVRNSIWSCWSGGLNFGKIMRLKLIGVTEFGIITK